MPTLATALERLLKADDQPTRRQVIGDPESCRDAGAPLDADLQVRPAPFDRRALNTR